MIASLLATTASLASVHSHRFAASALMAPSLTHGRHARTPPPPPPPPFPAIP